MAVQVDDIERAAIVAVELMIEESNLLSVGRYAYVTDVAVRRIEHVAYRKLELAGAPGIADDGQLRTIR